MSADYFSQEHLLRILTRAPNATWRFDIDVSLEAAVRMALFAHDYADVHGTFYVASVLPTYNPFSAQAVRQLEHIGGLGHRIGLHAYAPYTVADAVERQVAEQGALLADYLAAQGRDGIREDIVSFHKPTPDLLWRDFDAFESAYASKWEGRYLSDARRRWDAEKDARVADDMQICLHAEHWDLR